MPLAERLVDLHPIVKDNYYHPAMHGSWSIKAVLPTIAPELDYKKLGAIQEGTAAQVAYVEAISLELQTARREEIRKSLLEYCKHDTLALVTVTMFMAQQPPEHN
jgi:predicted RecB family nuclease